MTTHAAAPDPASAFRLRLLRLEAALAGAAPVTAALEASTERTAPRGLSVQRRTLEIKDALDRIPARGNEALKRFILNYDAYLPLIAPYGSRHAVGATLVDADADGVERPAIREDDLLPDLAKLGIVLQAEEDLVYLDRGLREVQLLEQQGAAGAGVLADHERHHARLQALRAKYATAIARHHQRERSVHALLARYDQYVSTLSEVFVGVNARVTRLEDAVARLEKRRRDEVVETY